MLARYGTCATAEVAAVFEISDDRAEMLMDELEAEGVVIRREAGSGLLWEPSESAEGGQKMARTVNRE